MTFINTIIKKLYPITGDVNDEFLLRKWSELRDKVDSGMHDTTPHFNQDQYEEEIIDSIRRIASVNTAAMICSMFPYFASPHEVISFFDQKGLHDSDYNKIVDTVIAIRNNSIRTRSKFEIKKEYQNFCKQAQETEAIPLEFDDYRQLRDAVISFAVDTMFVEVSLGYATRNYRGELIISQKRKIDDIMAALANDLQLSIEQRLEFCADSFDEDVSTEEIVQAYPKGKFSKIGNDEAQEIVIGAGNLILKETPLKIAKRVYVSKVTEFYRMDPKVGEVKRVKTLNSLMATNVPIEAGIVKEIVLKNVSESRSDAVIINPSPFFVDEWINSEENNNGKTTFVIVNDDMRYMLESHYEDENYCTVIPKNTEFHSMEHLGQIELEGAVACVFQGTITENEYRLWIEIMKRKAIKSLVAFGSDSFCKQTVLSVEDKPFSLITLPSKVIGSAGCKFCSIVESITQNENDNISVYRAHPLTESQGLYRVAVVPDGHIGRKTLEASTTLRKDTQRIHNGIKARKAPTVYHFSPEIEIHISHSTNKGFTKGKAYIKDQGKQVANSTVCFKRKSIDLGDWAINEYPFRIITQGSGGSISVKKVISDIINAQYEGTPISLRTVWYCTNNVEDYFSKREQELLKSVMLSNLGLLIPVGVSTREIETMIKEEYPNEGSNYRDTVFRIIVKMISLSVEQGHTKEEYGGYRESELYALQYGKANLGKMLKRRSFDQTMIRRITDAVLCKRAGIDDKGLQLAAFMRIIWGLEAEAIAVLQVRDIIENDEGEFNVMIRRACDPDRSEIRGVSRQHQKRLLPCTLMMKELIQGCISDIQSEDMSNGEYGSCAILGETITPRIITEACRHVLGEMGVKDAFVYAQDSRRELHKINLSALSVDVFRGNVSYWGRKVASMWDDEINYIFGIARETTDGKHYIDFMSEGSQTRLRRKLQIIEDYFRGIRNDR